MTARFHRTENDIPLLQVVKKRKAYTLYIVEYLYIPPKLAPLNPVHHLAYTHNLVKSKERNLIKIASGKAHKEKWKLKFQYDSAYKHYRKKFIVLICVPGIQNVNQKENYIR